MTAPRLGFGTASVLGRHDRATSDRAIARAYALGVRHFDTARSYGWGDAEALLGKVLRDKPRGELTIVTKCGIVPARRQKGLQAAKALARSLVKLVPGLRKSVQRVASNAALQPSRTFDLDVLAASFETSLAELGMDYVDVLILHNFEPGKPGLAEVETWMRGLRDAGRVKAYGVSVTGDLHAALEWLAAEKLFEGAVVQAPVSAGLFALPEALGDRDFILHSPFRYLADHGGTLEDLRARIGDTVRCRAIVCAMFGEAHLAANARAFGLPGQ